MDNVDTVEEAKPIVHGDPENGFIVEHHDGETHRTHGCMAGSEDEAISQARKKWDEDDTAAAEQERHSPDSEHASAKRMSRAEIESMLAERDEKIAGLENRAADHDRKFEAIHKVLDEIAKPIEDIKE